MRGLKYSEKNQCRGSAGSHRSRGAWIEITLYFDEAGHFKSHRSRGAWIEMRRSTEPESHDESRIAHAVRGLKCLLCSSVAVIKCRIAHAVRGLKCIYSRSGPSGTGRIAHAVRGLKYMHQIGESQEQPSHRSRGAWIEIHKVRRDDTVQRVASLTRCVD